MAGGVLVSINIAPDAGAPMRSVTEVKAVEGRGLEGDRYFQKRGTFVKQRKSESVDREVTLIEEEAVQAAAVQYEVVAPPGDIRRNLVTRGVALNHLVGREFQVGAVRLRGIRLCEPCEHMEELCGKPGIRKALVHRGGLRAAIVRGGSIKVGDAVRVE